MNNDRNLKKYDGRYADPYDLNSNINDDFETMSSTSTNDPLNNEGANHKPTAKVSPLSIINMYSSSTEATNDDSKFTTAHKLFDSKNLEGNESNEDYFNLDPDVDNFPVVPKPRSSHNYYGASNNNSAMQYETPWDLSCIQINLEERLQGLMKSPSNHDASHCDTLQMDSPTSTIAPAMPSLAQQNDPRPQDGYDKPWNLRPEHKDDRGAEGYDKPWDMKPHNKDERPSSEYDVPWDKNARKIERNFRNLQRESAKFDQADIRRGANLHKRCNSNVDRDRRDQTKSSSQVRSPVVESNDFFVGANCKNSDGLERNLQYRRKENLMNRSCISSYENVDLLHRNYTKDSNNNSDNKNFNLNINNQNRINNYDNINFKQSANNLNQNCNPINLRAVPSNNNKSNNNNNNNKNINNNNSSNFCSSVINGRSPEDVVHNLSNKNNVASKLLDNSNNSRQSVAVADKIGNNNNNMGSKNNNINNKMSVSMMVRSSKLLDTRSNEEYDEPWDQKIKNMMLAQANKMKEKDIISAPPATAAVVASSSAAASAAAVAVVPAPRNRIRRSSKSIPFDVKANLESQSWYHGLISRTQAEDILRPHKEGSYLVRTSESNHADYSLSVKSTKGFIHMRIVHRREDGGQYILGQFSQPFLSIPQMVYHYTVNKLPIKGAEHISLTYPIAQELL